MMANIGTETSTGIHPKNIHNAALDKRLRNIESDQTLNKLVLCEEESEVISNFPNLIPNNAPDARDIKNKSITQGIHNSWRNVLCCNERCCRE